MLGSHLTIAVRHLLGQKLYSAINIFGLAVGLACCILISLYIKHELSYDRHYAEADRIYRISRDFFSDGGSSRNLLAANAPPVAELLKLDFPQIEQAARLYCCGAILASSPEGRYYENAFLADNALFEIFDFDWLHGDPATALLEPYTLVVTEKAAQRYFGNADPMGKTLMAENQWPVRVTGVIRDLPDNTHLSFDLLLSLPTAIALYDEQFVQGWTSNNFHTYVLLEDGADIAAIQSQSAAFFERHFREGSSEFTGFTAYALPDIHLRSNRGFEIGTPGSIGKLWGFGAVAILILLIASMNFVNLATARSVQRAKEIGVRKVVGADRSRIIVQFLGESMLVTLLAVIIAAGIVALTLPVFSTFLEKNLTLTFFGDGTILPTLAALVLTVGLVAGSYPALYLSSFEPARVLKGNLTRGVSAARSRKLFVVLQFAISITLTIATAVVYSQMRFAETIELGYNKDRIVILSGTTTRGLGESWDTFKERLLAHPEITHATASQLTPGVPNTDSTGLRHEGGDSDDRPMPFMFIDFDFFETFQIDLLAGRTFSEKFAADGMTAPTEGVAGREAAFMINGLAARQLGWTPTSAIGKWLEVGFFDTRGEIVGVVADVYFESVRRAMKPLVFMIPPAEMFGVPALREASLRITGRDLANTLAYIDSTWAEFVPGTPIGRRFLDDDLQTLYQDERRQAQILTFFSTLAIVVACLGLFGVGLFTSERRTKEIGIRKAMGGSVWSIVALLTAEFSKLVVVAFLLAWPIAYVAMSAWLESFAYRVDLNPFVFLGSGLLALLIAWLTVGGVAARAAMIKPARALRYE